MSRTHLSLLLFVLTLLPRGAAYAQDSEPFSWLRTIVIDPGHGGQDSGAIGIGGVQEKDLTLAISLGLRDAIAAADPGVEVTLTREDDTYPSLEGRTHLANMVDADLFVSVHFNCSEAWEAHGIETYWISADGTAPGDLVPGQEEEGPATPWTPVGVSGDLRALVLEDLTREGAVQGSARLAEEIQSSLVASTDFRDRGVKQGRFRVLRGARMPAVVLELGFICHAAEGKRVQESEMQQVLIDAVVAGLRSYDDFAAAEATSVVIREPDSEGTLTASAGR